jgi:hypothetical protein
VMWQVFSACLFDYFWICELSDKTYFKSHSINVLLFTRPLLKDPAGRHNNDDLALHTF